MKVILKTLLIVVLIIGIAWFFFVKEKNPPKGISVTPTPQSNVVLTDGRQCYSYSHEATADAPYSVQEFLDITIVGKNVTGKKTGTQSGPDMTNGYEGTISGTLENNTITALFAYMIEGSKNTEQELYSGSKVGIEKLRYPLVEKNNMLVPDTTKEFTALSYARVECEGSN